MLEKKSVVLLYLLLYTILIYLPTHYLYRYRSMKKILCNLYHFSKEKGDKWWKRKMLQQPILCPVIRDGSFIFPVFSFFLLHWLTCFLTTNIANKLKQNFISQSDRYAYYKVNTQHISAKFGKNLITYLLTKYICKYLSTSTYKVCTGNETTNLLHFVFKIF